MLLIVCMIISTKLGKKKTFPFGTLNFCLPFFQRIEEKNIFKPIIQARLYKYILVGFLEVLLLILHQQKLIEFHESPLWLRNSLEFSNCEHIGRLSLEYNIFHIKDVQDLVQIFLLFCIIRSTQQADSPRLNFKSWRYSIFAWSGEPFLKF